MPMNAPSDIRYSLLISNWLTNENFKALSNYFSNWLSYLLSSNVFENDVHFWLYRYQRRKNVREANDVCMRKKEKRNIERKKRTNMLEKKTLTTKMSRYQNNRMVSSAKEKISSLNVCRKLSRQYLHLLDKHNVIILRSYRHKYCLDTRENNKPKKQKMKIMIQSCSCNW